MSTGHYRAQAEKVRKEKCPKSPRKDKTHKWQEHGSWPSQWWECQYCKATIYDK